MIRDALRYRAFSICMAFLVIALLSYSSSTRAGQRPFIATTDVTASRGDHSSARWSLVTRVGQTASVPYGGATGFSVKVEKLPQNDQFQAFFLFQDDIKNVKATNTIVRADEERDLVQDVGGVRWRCKIKVARSKE